MREINLPPGYQLRPAAWSDLEAITVLIYAVCEADGDTSVALSKDDLRLEWQAPGFELETDAWVVCAQDGQVIGYEEFFDKYEHSNLQGDGYVHPQFRDLGVGSALLKVLDERAQQEVPLAAPDLRVYVRNGLDTHDRSGREMHEAAGFSAIRFSWRMEIQLSEPTAPAVWPIGVELRPFVRERQARQVFNAIEEAFADHWGHTPMEYETWELLKLKRETFDPSLWHIAWDGDQIAGVSACRLRNEIGWVGTLGVRRPWRKQGLGMALLLHSFGEFQRRGENVIGLGVDASNPSGATRLYERAGMRVASEFVIYEKEYRAGREPEEA